MSPRQWAPAGPSPRPRTAPATRARGRGRGLWGPGAPGGGGVGGPWGARGRDWIGGREQQNVREIPNSCSKCLGDPSRVPGCQGSLHSCKGDAGRTGWCPRPYWWQGSSLPARQLRGGGARQSKGAGVLACVGGPLVPLRTAGEGGNPWARAGRAADTCPSRRSTSCRSASCRSQIPSAPRCRAGTRE